MLFALAVAPHASDALAAPARAPLAQAATPTPAGSATPPQPGPGPTTRGMVGPIIGVVLVFMASAVAFGFAMGLRRRINEIAGPDPDPEDEDDL